MFILGDAMTLQLLNTHTHERKLIASDIGRCMKLSHDKKQLLFVIKQNKTEWSIFKMDIETRGITKIVTTLKDNEDFAELPDGTLLMGSEGKLFQYLPGVSSDWQLASDFSSSLNSFYRISINLTGDKIALVAYTGKKP
jgi:Tol biopolymer transport system component